MHGIKASVLASEGLTEAEAFTGEMEIGMAVMASEGRRARAPRPSSRSGPPTSRVADPTLPGEHESVRSPPMRRTAVLVALLLPLLALVAGACNDDDGGDDGTSGTTVLGDDFGPGDEPEGLVIGSVLSQTGSAAPYGSSQQQGIELAADELGFGDAALIIVDDESTEEAGSLAMDSVLAANVGVVIGPTLSPVAGAADPSAQAAQVPVLAASNTTLDIAAIGDHIWRVTLSETAMIPQAIAGADAEYDLTTAAIISQPSDAYSVGVAEAFRTGAAEHGVEVVADVTYDDGEDVAAVLTEATAGAPDALFLAARSDFAADLLVSIDELGLEQHLVGGNGFNAPEVFEAAGDAVNGLIVAAPVERRDRQPRERGVRRGLPGRLRRGARCVRRHGLRLGADRGGRRRAERRHHGRRHPGRPRRAGRDRHHPRPVQLRREPRAPVPRRRPDRRSRRLRPPRDDYHATCDSTWTLRQVADAIWDAVASRRCPRRRGARGVSSGWSASTRSSQ